MPIIVANDISKGFTGSPLFDGATFEIENGDKIAVVGPNGAGKSTLLKILSGAIKPDNGSLQVTGGQIHWFDQHPKIPAGATVQDLLSSQGEIPSHLAGRKEELETRIADPALYEQPGYEGVLEEYALLEREIKLATSGTLENSPILNELGIAHFDRLASKLSGGEKTRIFLARALQNVKPNDILFLDEPTNHLDVDTIEWLEDWLNKFEGTCLMVAHDRVFLDNVATRVFEVANGKVTCYAGNYEDYVEARDENLERAKRDIARAEEKLAGAKATIQQFRHQKRFDGQYASRMKAVEKYAKALQSKPDVVMQTAGFGLGFGDVDKSSNEMIRIAGLSKSYDEKVLAKLDFEITKGERVGIVGGNGAGKTTLLRIITGQEQPDAGNIHAAPGVKGAFFSQEHDDLDVDRTLKQEVQHARPKIEETEIKGLLGSFKFNPDLDMQRKVGTLSGGERQRLMLLKCVLKPSNLLILDEPTNHLDLWAKDAVISALQSYGGTIMVVSHDRFLLDAVTQRTAFLEDGVFHNYNGSFSEIRDLHKQKTTAKSEIRFRVVKKFSDWSKGRKYSRDEEFATTEGEFGASMTLRNALKQGWIERL